MEDKHIFVRKQAIEDAADLFRILNQGFVYFDVQPKTIDEEIEWLEQVDDRWENKIEYDFSIIFDGKVIGGLGFKMNIHRPHITEIGMFIDKDYQNKGIAGIAEQLALQYLLEKEKVEIIRLESIIKIDNEPSLNAAIKAGFKKEGILRSCIKDKKGNYVDAYILSIILKEVLNG